MQHFYQNIEGWFSYEYIYKHAVNQARTNALFVEIGSFKGRSSAYLATEILNSGKSIQLCCIDTWAGSTEHQQGGECEVKEVVEGTLYETFLTNMKPVEGYYRPLRMTSLEAVNLFEDQSIDFLMIDGEHSFDAVSAEIRAYLPKMRPGGLMTGDDVWGEVAQAVDQELSKKGYEVQYTASHFQCIIPHK